MDANLAVTYIRLKGDDFFTIIIHPIDRTLESLVGELPQAATLFLKGYLSTDPAERELQYYAYTMELFTRVPVAPVTWLDGDTQIMGDQIYLPHIMQGLPGKFRGFREPPVTEYVSGE